MKKRLITIIATLLCVPLWAQDPTALLLVHFGTTHDDARARTLDVISAKARQQYPNAAPLLS